MTTPEKPDDVSVPRSLLLMVLVIALLGVGVAMGVSAAILIRAGLSVPVSRAIAFTAMAWLLYPLFKMRAAMRQGAPPVPFWKWAIIWTITMGIGTVVLAPLVDRLLGG
jgi:hypothetical protein